MQKTRSIRVQDNARLGGKGDLQEIMQEIKIWPY